jgi:hypothetical protein
MKPFIVTQRVWSRAANSISTSTSRLQISPSISQYPIQTFSTSSRELFLNTSSLSPYLQTLAQNIHNGNRVALSRALTLIESNRQDHREASVQLLTYLQHLQTQQQSRSHHSRNNGSISSARDTSVPKKDTIRIGISGSPGRRHNLHYI